MKKLLGGAALIIAMMIVGGCTAPQTGSAPVRPTPSRTEASPTPTQISTPPPPRSVGFDCLSEKPKKNTWDQPSYDRVTFKTVQEVWSAPGISSCEVIVVTHGDYSTSERAAVEAAGYDSIANVKILWEICSETDSFYQVNGPINDAQRKEVNAALILCPDHPSATVMANGSPEQQERASGLRFGDGVREVGSQIQPGTYRATGQIKNCYWERLDSAGEIIDNNFVLAATQVEVTVLAGDFSLHTDGCGEFVKVS